MYVLHACALPDAQYGIDIGMWAEDSALPVSSPSAAVRQVRDHPFAVPTDSLADILGRSEGARRTPQTLLLPSLQRSPLDPPEMVRIQPRRRSSSAPSLLPWSVPVMRIPASELSSVLDSILGDQSEVDVRPAASVHYVAELRRHGEMLVDRSRVLPTCVIVGRDDEDDNDTTTT
ncbi:MAG: ATP-dependent helicase, partial [Brevibacterium aurantiacum]|nr:ATP-dependent helicase [Brevibacterium aurantiacum]